MNRALGATGHQLQARVDLEDAPALAPHHLALHEIRAQRACQRNHGVFGLRLQTERPALRCCRRRGGLRSQRLGARTQLRCPALIDLGGKESGFPIPVAGKLL